MVITVTLQAYQPPTPTHEPRYLALPLEDWHDLFQPTSECQLPCWWGVRPGTTHQEEISSQFLTYFESVTDYDLSYWEGRLLRDFDYLIDESDSPRAFLIANKAYDEEEVLDLLAIDAP